MEYRTTYHHRDGVKRTSIEDSERPGQLRVFTEVEMDAVLEGVKRDREALSPGSTNKLLARAPLTVVEQSIHEQWDEGDWKKWLNDPANACFRVWPGRV
jgi:hypothetical protein